MNHIYFFYDTNKNLLYVGKTTNLPQRISAHFSKAIMSTDTWKKNVDLTNIVVYRCTTNTDLEIYETYFINKYKPLHNKDKVYYDSATFELPELKPNLYIYSPYKKTSDNGKTTKAFLTYIDLRSKEPKTGEELEKIRLLEVEFPNFESDYNTEKRDDILMDRQILKQMNSWSLRERLVFADRMNFTNTYIRFDSKTQTVKYR